MKRELDTNIPARFQDEKALLIPPNSTGNWKEGEKQDHIVCTELFTNVISWGQIHMMAEV